MILKLICPKLQPLSPSLSPSCSSYKMKDLSLFLLKNSLGAKMRKSIRTFCSGDDSTSTLTQLDKPPHHEPAVVKSSEKSLPTLEEMILQLELEEEAARKAKLLDQHGVRGRMSCVNNSDILRSARNALNHYPRFSLDGKDAMYRSSFKNTTNSDGRKSICCERGLRRRLCDIGTESKVGGERVVWCKPGVVAKLMGLEAMPIPILGNKVNKQKRCSGSSRRGGSRSCTSKTDYYVLNPVAVASLEPQLMCRGGGWPTARFV